MRWVAAAAFLALGCAGASSSSGTGRVQLAVPGASDTVRFEVPVVARRCGPGHGLLFQGEQNGAGLLIWLRDTSTPGAGTYPLLSRGDSVTPRGAIATARFLVAQRTGGITIDDGTVTLSRATAPFALQVTGLGVETAFAQQRRATLALENVPLLPDSVPCQVEP